MSDVVGPMDAARMRDALRACRLFAGVDDKSLDVVAAAVRPRRFRRFAIAARR